MTEPTLQRAQIPPGLYSTIAGVVLLMWVFLGVIGAVFVCGLIGLNETFPLPEPGGPARQPVSQATYWWILGGGVAVGCLGYWVHKPRTVDVVDDDPDC